MGRELRPQKARPSYALQFEDGEEGEGFVVGPSKNPAYDDDPDSGSDFAPPPAEENNAGGDVEGSEGDDMSVEDEAPGNLKMDAVEEGEERNIDGVIVLSTRRNPRKGKWQSDMATMNTTPGLSGPSKRQMFVLPNPSVHHRHRAVPLFASALRSERLTAVPMPFTLPKTVQTNPFTHNPKITDRVNKAWGYNVGKGPLWEMLEDRACWKEALDSKDPVSEASRRPRVHKRVFVAEGEWWLFDETEAAPYMPSDLETTEDGTLKPPPPISCYFGPHDDQTLVTMAMLDGHKMSDYIPESNAHTFNAGAPVWGLDWCPTHSEDRPGRDFKHYLAVGPFPTRTHSPEIGSKIPRPAPACVQIWTLSATDAKPNKDHGAMKCEMVICINSGPAHELKWCPLPSHDSIDESLETGPRKLGLLAGTFGDGSLSIFTIPEPVDVIPEDHDPTKPVYVYLSEPLIRIELEDAACWTLDWANSEVLAVGCSNGSIAVYDIGDALRSETYHDLIPTHYISAHQSAIRALAWIRAPPASGHGSHDPESEQTPLGDILIHENPTVIASGGYDGAECFTDIREGTCHTMNRTRDVINAMTFSIFGCGPITIDHENLVKAYSASPSMLGRGHSLLDPAGPVWYLAASDYHPQLAVAAADGSCSTTNTLRSTRRGGSVPFFVHKVYQMDYSRNTGEWRMLERFLPVETQDRPSVNRQRKNQKDVDVHPTGSGAWPSEAAVHRVTWHNGAGMHGASLLASGTASGLCRVDWLTGRWLKGKIPYNTVARVRMDEDADGDGDASASSDD